MPLNHEDILISWYRSRLAINCVKQPWKKRQLKRAEKTAMKQLEKELKETAEKEKEVYTVYCVHMHLLYTQYWFNSCYLHNTYLCTGKKEKNRGKETKKAGKSEES